MTKETAYSSKYGEEITAIKANELALNGTLKDKHAFQCSPTCSVPYTCANFNTYPNDRKKAPYFVCGNQDALHDKNCPVGIEIRKNKQSKLNQTEIKNSGNFRLNLDVNGFKPITNTQIKNSSKVISNSDNENPNEDSNNDQNKKIINSNINSLRKLVSIYNSDEYNNKLTPLKIGNTSLILDDLFVDMQETNMLPTNTKVFHGKFWINDNHDSFKFNSVNKHTYDNTTNRVSFFIDKKIINDDLLNKITIESNINKPFYIYCYSKIAKNWFKDKYYLNLEYQGNINNLFFNFNS